MNVPQANFVWSSEGYSRGRFNSLGFNDREPVHVGNVKHIFVVGDSYTEAFQVDANHSYVQLVEDGLSQIRNNGTQTVDLIKIGRDGFTPADYPFVIRRYYSLFKPETIILQFGEHSGSDLLSANIKITESKEGHIASLHAGQKSEDSLKEIFRQYISHSALFYSMARRFKPFVTQFLRRSSHPFTTDKKAASQNPDKHNTDYFELVRRLDFILSDIINTGSEVIVLYLPPPGYYLEKKDHMARETLHALVEICHRHKIKLLDLTSHFQEEFSYTKTMLNGFINSLPNRGHLNRNGHKIVAEEIIRYFKDAMQGPSAPSEATEQDQT